MTAVPLTDLGTVSAWSTTIVPLGEPLDPDTWLSVLEDEPLKRS